MLAEALQAEADCPHATMMSVCADSYVRDNITVEVNGTPVTITKQQMQMAQSSVILVYEVKSDEFVESIGVESSYMLRHNDHTILRVGFDMGEKPRLFTMSNSRTQIKADFTTKSAQ